MATEIMIPQMGESITECTITKWSKDIGDAVEKEEIIFEVCTDTMDIEIPSPTAGVLLEIRGKVGDTLEVGTVVAILGDAGGRGASVTNNKNNAMQDNQNNQAQQDAQRAQTPTTRNATTKVVMPRVMEFVTEGTITRWLKNVGDAVEKGEMILQIAVDVVDVEIPSPAAGVLLKICGNVDDTFEVGTVVAIVSDAGVRPTAEDATLI